jgi:hypothetical protein
MRNYQAANNGALPKTVAELDEFVKKPGIAGADEYFLARAAMAKKTFSDLTKIPDYLKPFIEKLKDFGTNEAGAADPRFLKMDALYWIAAANMLVEISRRDGDPEAIKQYLLTDAPGYLKSLIGEDEAGARQLRNWMSL